MKNYFSLFSTKTYVVGTQKNCLIESAKTFEFMSKVFLTTGRACLEIVHPRSSCQT